MLSCSKNSTNIGHKYCQCFIFDHTKVIRGGRIFLASDIPIQKDQTYTYSVMLVKQNCVMQIRTSQESPQYKVTLECCETQFKFIVEQLEQSGCEAWVKYRVRSPSFYVLERKFWPEQSSWGSKPGFASKTFCWRV